LESPTGEKVHALCFSPDSKLLVIYRDYSPGASYCVYLWQWELGKHALQLEIPVDVLGLCFSGDSRLMAGQDGGGIYLWDTTTGKEIPSIPRHREKVTALAFTRDGRSLL